ncbi:MAG: hypothetical protein K9L57_06040 [Spirochaetaceae bacterium]|nr:hypothetical protein [Spirochaetaceae bacterium]
MDIENEYLSDNLTEEEKEDIIYYLRKHNSEISEKEVEKILTEKFSNDNPQEFFQVIISYDSNEQKDMNIILKRYKDKNEGILTEIVYRLDYHRNS